MEKQHLDDLERERAPLPQVLTGTSYERSAQESVNLHSYVAGGDRDPIRENK
jgi:hypothetical protein